MPRASSRAATLWARRHPVLAGGIVVGGVLLTGLLVDLWRVRAEVDAGRTALSSLSVEQLDGDLVATIGSATAHLDRADRIADRSPFLSVLGMVPGARGQVDGLRTLTEAASQLGASARQAASAIDVDLDAAGHEPAARLRLLDTIAHELDRIQADAGRIDLAEDHELAGPLGDARAELRAELDRLPKRFGDARTRVRALKRVLDGPTRYLVLAANNAEMRGGAGMPLSGGVLTIRDGDLDFGEFESIANRWAGPIDRGLVPVEYARTYRQFRVGQSWLQTAVSPNYPAIAPIYDAMSSAFPSFGSVDGVVVVDTVTLRHLLAVIGPVKVEGETYTPDNVEQRLLNESYLHFDTSGAQREERRDQQGAVATEIFDALKSRDVGIAALATAIQDSAAGRHLLAYAEDTEVQAMFDDVGASGKLFRAGLMVTVQNIAADKLDWYIDPSVTIRTVPVTGSHAYKVRLSVRIPNPEREGDTSGVESYKDGYKQGIHRALVAVYLPEAAYDIHSLDLDFSETGSDPPLQMVGKRVFVEEGASRTLAIEFQLPADHPGVLLLPSGRVRPMRVTVNGMVTDDARARPLLFLDPPGDDGLAPGPVIAALLALAGAATLLPATRRGRQRRERPLVAASALEQRLPSLGILLVAAAAATLLVFAAVDSFRPR
ncbi:MAG: DUF4012 domain-containing protein [Acidimicrobiales bacterium]